MSSAVFGLFQKLQKHLVVTQVSRDIFETLEGDLPVGQVGEINKKNKLDIFTVQTVESRCHPH